ncbi:TPA: GDP-mannose mannosyl hydrolase [Vibrio alginolyticus]|nr:GDP-mannose mannosyl hydrolase [Vibrio alginolyticus]
MYLDTETFKGIVKNTPLISIDLIVKNSQGKVLLGHRNNRPAKNYWFVPGGRIVKDETFTEAFKRLSQIELGKVVSLKEAKFIGPYEHHYIDNFSGSDFSTHYIVLGYEIALDIDLGDLPSEQHGRYEWWDVEDLLSSQMVHQHTKDYFLK